VITKSDQQIEALTARAYRKWAHSLKCKPAPQTVLNNHKSWSTNRSSSSPAIKREPAASGLDRNNCPESSKSALWPSFAAKAYKNRDDRPKSHFVAFLHLSFSNNHSIDLCAISWVQIHQPIGVLDSQKQGVLFWYRWMINYDVVGWSTANEGKVATQLMG